MPLSDEIPVLDNLTNPVVCTGMPIKLLRHRQQKKKNNYGNLLVVLNMYVFD